ncbi:hypothetical protein DICVIV_05716 [Dictyocaulus viviparus]|uniref:Uncharacterized protein n=1 Tax=Dictyocaulus viviparus TaxID=29172 RepID=A0A0D8XUC5_DICVI|nr:hypothetical protein DICVIV_05716 [Dictyocaulus viviparus]
MNESILIETRNRINANESRILQKDIAMREQELKDIKETLTKAKRDLSIERNKRITAEDNLKRKAVEVEELDHKLKEMNDVANRLKERLLDKDQIITQLGSDVSEAKFEISSLEAELNKSRRDMEDVRMRNRTLSLDINTLKVALADCEEELRRSLDNAKYQKENMTKTEIDIRRSLESNLVTHNLSTSRNLINAFQSLSSQILTIQRTQLSTEQKIGELTATNKFLEEKILGYKEKEEVLLKRVVELQEDCETAKIELSEMQRKLIEVEGNSSLTHKFLLEESNKIEKSKINEEEISKLRAELDLCRSHEDDLKRSETRLKTQLCLSEEKVKELEKSLSSVRSEVDDLSVEKDLNRELRLELKNAETKLVELTNALQIVDSQCEQFRELRKRADISKQKALDECASVTTKLRKIEKELERQRNFEVEVNQLRAEKERLEMKIRYLNIDEMKRQIAQFDNISRGNKRKLDELEKENQILQEQISAGVARELVATNENKKLRGGLADAVVKIELYKNEAEHSKKSCEQLAVQLALNEERINKLEEEVINLEEALREKEKLEAYLQSQIKTKDMPKLSRRSTLLRSSTESSFKFHSSVMSDKILELMTRKMMPLTLRSGDQTSVPYIPPRHPLTELQSNFVTDICTYHKEKSSNITIPISQKAVMRHDIPHKWAELRHFGLFSIKCAVCFVGVPTNGTIFIVKFLYNSREFLILNGEHGWTASVSTESKAYASYA